MNQAGNADGVQCRNGLAADVEHHHHEVCFKRSDGLDVGLEPAQVRYRRLCWVIGSIVDRSHLVSRLDGEEHLGAGR